MDKAYLHASQRANTKHIHHCKHTRLPSFEGKIRSHADSLFFVVVLSKTQIRVIECIALKLLKTKTYVIKANVTSPYEKPGGRLVNYAE